MNFKDIYNRKNYLKFFQERFLPDDFSIENENITFSFTPYHIKKVSFIGKVESLDDLRIYEVHHTSENDPRVSLSKDIFRIMRDYSVRNALILFVSDNSDNYRFSLATINFSLEDKKVKKEYSNPRRYSFFLGPDSKTHTPEEFLIKKGKVKDFKDLLSRFSSEVVTNAFFKEYKIIFSDLKNSLYKQKLTDLKTCHEFALQLFNRTMFIYFIQKKGWLGENKNFIEFLWNEYLASGGKNKFYSEWLSVVFFSAFNNKVPRRNYFSKELNNILMLSPYLNGGLFKENDLDKIEFDLKDKLFEDMYGFFGKYNFTINESSAVDIDLEVDPKLIGDVYESLVNISDDDDEQSQRGIFYTDRNEIDLMCKMSLIKLFNNHLSNEELWIGYFFGNEDERTIALEDITKKHMWNDIKFRIENLTIIDPACGSGSFLVYMLIIISELYREACMRLNIEISDYEIKKIIISKCLYGVDVKKWAVNIAELRLWLQLIVDTELELAERRAAPLLPNLDLNLRCGDSLVQEVAGINFSLKNLDKKKFKRKLENLKLEKYKYIISAEDRKYKTERSVKVAEIKLFVILFDEQIEELKEELRKRKSGEEVTKIDIMGNEMVVRDKNLFSDKSKVEVLESKIKIIENEKKKLFNFENKPFVWDLDFVEIFSDEDKNGFDIVIGNPPYVRAGAIANPNIPDNKNTLESRKQYKDKLALSVKSLFSSIDKIDRNSDLYIYFYFHGLALLNPKGIFCFITSNSWLDVGYGKILQEYLLNNVIIYGIFDNQAKRSFVNADVNTVISLFSSPSAYKKADYHKNVCRFVMFKKPFDEIKQKNVFEQLLLKNINHLDKIINKNFCRVYQVTQKELYNEGIELEENEGQILNSNGVYVGDKWGGKYLRAPDIYYSIIEKIKNNLIYLGSIVRIRRGFSTGLNEFFYLDQYTVNKWRIEKKFLKSVIKSPRESKQIIIDDSKTELSIFMCNKNKSILKGSNALKYILWGEKQKNEKGEYWNQVPTVKNRALWYELFENDNDDLIIPRTFNDTYICHKGGINYSDRFYGINTEHKNLIHYLNSSIFILFSESLAKQGLGLGALDLNIREIIKIPVIINFKKSLVINREIKNVFEECGISPNIDIRSQEPTPLPDRKQLDDIVFDAIGLTVEERKEVYWSVCELVWNRLNKAKSV